MKKRREYGEGMFDNLQDTLKLAAGFYLVVLLLIWILSL